MFTHKNYAFTTNLRVRVWLLHRRLHKHGFWLNWGLILFQCSWGYFSNHCKKVFDLIIGPQSKTKRHDCHQMHPATQPSHFQLLPSTIYTWWASSTLDDIYIKVVSSLQFLNQMNGKPSLNHLLGTNATFVLISSWAKRRHYLIDFKEWFFHTLLLRGISCFSRELQ